MITKFPDNWELINFFECEPKVIDPNAPWLYNKLEFVYKRGMEEIHTSISPSYGKFHFTYYHDKRLIFDMDYSAVDECTITSEHDKHYMLLRFRKEEKMKDVLLFLKPGITLVGGNRVV